MEEHIYIYFENSRHRIEIRDGRYWVWETSGYGYPTMTKALEAIQKEVGHTEVSKIVTKTFRTF